VSNHTTSKSSNKPLQPTLFEAPMQIYQSEHGDVEVTLTDGDMWLSQKTMALMFGITQQAVAYQVNKLIEEDELDDSVYKESLYTASDGKKYKILQYNLDVVLPVGYRVHSSEASKFRKWANNVLREYITKGIVFNPDSPKARYIKKQLDLVDKAGWDNESGIRHLTLQLGLVESLKVINTMVKQVIVNPNYGQLMNTEYEALFGMTASGLKAILNGNARDALSNEGMATLLFAETMIAGLLSRSKTMTMLDAIALYRDAMKPIRIMHDSLCEQFGIHPVTGKPLLSSGK
jgi:hypothetical protein